MLPCTLVYKWKFWTHFSSWGSPIITLRDLERACWIGPPANSETIAASWSWKSIPDMHLWTVDKACHCYRKDMHGSNSSVYMECNRKFYACLQKTCSSNSWCNDDFFLFWDVSSLLPSTGLYIGWLLLCPQSRVCFQGGVFNGNIMILVARGKQYHVTFCLITCIPHGYTPLGDYIPFCGVRVLPRKAGQSGAHLLHHTMLVVTAITSKGFRVVFLLSSTL